MLRILKICIITSFRQDCNTAGHDKVVHWAVGHFFYSYCSPERYKIMNKIKDTSAVLGNNTKTSLQQELAKESCTTEEQFSSLF